MVDNRMLATTADIFDPHQQAAHDKLIAENGGIVWMNVGDGKTRVALMAAVNIAQDSGHPVVLVVARRAAFYDWQQEIATLQLDVDVLEAELSTERQLVEATRTTIVLISEGMISNFIIQDICLKLANNHQIGVIIIDELWLYKNPKSERHKSIKTWTKLFPSIGISGSIMTARDIVDIYGQVAAIGRGESLARHLTNFREQFQTGISGAYFSWYPKKGAYKAIMDRIEPFVYLHMPKQTERKTRTNILKVCPTDQQLELLTELKQTAAIEGYFELNNVANIITKAQQISNGWLKGESGDITNIESSKVDRTVALVEEILEANSTNRVVIWCAFRHDINRLRDKMLLLSNVATLQSGQEFNHKLWAKSTCRICLATEASGTSVNHFAQVPYGIYFSQDFKWTSLQQSQGRHTRRSSLHDTAYFTFLHTEKSLDSQVFYTVKHATSAERSFIKQMDIKQWVEGK